MIKKISLILLSAALCFLCIACGNKDKTPEETTGPVHEFIMDATVNEQEVYKDEDITITLVSINWVENDGLDILFRLNDKQNRDLVLNVGSGVSINSYVLPTIDAYHDNKLSCVTISSNYLMNVGIKDVSNIQIDDIYIYDKSTESIIKDDIKVEIKTNIDATSSTQSEMDKNILAEDEKFDIYELRQKEKNGIGTICLDNKSENKISLIVSNFIVDGNEISKDVRVVSIASWPNSICSLDIASQIEMTCGVSRDDAKSVIADIIVYNYDTGETIHTVEEHEFVK